MKDIYSVVRASVKDGGSFRINFKKRTLSWNNKLIVVDGKPIDDWELTTCNVDKPEDIIGLIEVRFELYEHSIPGKHEPYNPWFKALRYKDLSNFDKDYGEDRTLMRFDLEYIVFAAICTGKLKWLDIDPTNSHWFWKSKKHENLIILRKWLDIF